MMNCYGLLYFALGWLYASLSCAVVVYVMFKKGFWK